MGWGGGGRGELEFLPGHHFLFHKGDGQLYFVTAGEAGNINFIINIYYIYFHHAMWPFMYFTYFSHIHFYLKTPGFP